MAEELVRPIVIKRIKKVSGGSHGGAWKIAYADFVTAMMAFFLLMWLLGSASKAQLEGIAELFKMPLKVALQGGKSSASNDSVIKNGGGKDLTKKEGQVKSSSELKLKPKSIDVNEAKKLLQKQEIEKLEELKKKIEKSIDENVTLRQFKDQLKLDLSTDGLRIQIIDKQNRPMFNSSKAELQPYAKTILHEIGKMINEVSNKISLSGHTDAMPYSRGGKYYSNWELSSDRANASRRELIAGGMDEKKILRVVGLASAVLFDKVDPMNPVNRRINIIVMTKKAEEDALRDSSLVDLPSEASASEVAAVIQSK